MNLKTILARFESALGYQNLAEEMVLLPEPQAPVSKKSKSTNQAKAINFIVGYNSSPKSQTALDITLWMAHQTRLVTTKEVTVQVVCVLEAPQSYGENTGNFAVGNALAAKPKVSDLEETFALNCAAPAIALPTAEIPSVSQRSTWSDPPYFRAIFGQNNQYEEVADMLLWQARCLAQEWRGLFKAHLRIGRVATELRNVVELEAANLLFLGCNSGNHRLIRELGNNFPCCVLGIPSALSYQMDIQPEEGLSKLQFATATPAR